MNLMIRLARWVSRERIRIVPNEVTHVFIVVSAVKPPMCYVTIHKATVKFQIGHGYRPSGSSS